MGFRTGQATWRVAVIPASHLQNLKLSLKQLLLRKAFQKLTVNELKNQRKIKFKVLEDSLDVHNCHQMGKQNMTNST